MIDFTCTGCHEPYSVPAELAGSDLQCTRCGLLMTVPRPSEVGNLNPDGTLVVADSPVVEDPDRLQTLSRLFGKQRVDETGELIDNRTLPEEIELEPMNAPVRTRPQYDPETGELLRPFAIAPAEVVPIADLAPPNAVSTTAPPLEYRARGSATDEARVVPPRAVKFELFQPRNILVMSIVVLAHLEICIDIGVGNSGYLMLAILPLAALLGLFTGFLLLAHYGNVVDEIARQDRDELPRPLRSLEWVEDLWRPFRNLLIPTFLMMGSCLLPLVAWLRADIPVAGCAVVTLAGLVMIVLQPAVILVFHVSGSLRNLRPDRVRQLIRSCGREYWMVALIGVAASIFYMAGFLGTGVRTAMRFGGPIAGFPDLKVFGSFPFTFMVLLVGIYLAHLFFWRVALLERIYHGKFGWVIQEHVRPKRKRPARLSPEERAALREAKRRQPGRQRVMATESLPGRQHM